MHNLQEEVRCKSREVENAQDESKRLRLIMNNEKIQLESNIEELQRDLQMKSAALQSLMLAKQVNNILLLFYYLLLLFISFFKFPLANVFFSGYQDK